MGLDLLIRNGTLVTMDRQMRIVPQGWIGVGDGLIRAVEAARPDTPWPDAAVTIDAAGGIVMPGLVNAHTHLPMTLFRGLADDLPLMTWLNERIIPAEARFIHPEAVRWATLLACGEMLLSGTTCCCDGYFHEAAVAEAVSHTGLRAVLAQGVIDLPAPGVPDPAQNIRQAMDFALQWKERSPTITPSIFCHAPYTCSDATIIAAKKSADALGLRFQIHVAETRMERERSIAQWGLSPVARLERLGVLDRHTLLVHCVWVDAADMALLAACGCAVAHCPESNMKLGSGIAPVTRLRAAGITVGLGTDGCASNNDLDLFGEMAMAAKLHKVSAGDPTALDAASVLQMATREGARAIGLGDAIGVLAPGRQADIVIIDTHAPHLTPIYHPDSHLVYAAGAGDVRHVLVAGRLVVRDRRLLTIDIHRTMAEVDRIARQVRTRRADV